MKYIIKKFPPESLEAYKAIEGACYDDMPKKVKDDVRRCLVSEQGGICCYCGKRITADYHSVIEHLYPKGLKQYSHLQLEYSNLLCSCDGGESERSGKPKSEKRKFPSFCDDKKNNRILKITPLDSDCENCFAYDEEGHIYGTTDNAIEAIEILGLDCSPLVNFRRAAIAPYIEIEKEDIEWLDEIEYLSQKHGENYLPFCVAAIYYIRNFKLVN